MNINSTLKGMVIAAVGINCLSCDSDKKSKASADNEVETIDVAYPEQDSILITYSYPGYLTAKSAIDVVGRVNGQLLSQNYNNGDKVAKGAVLFRIEDTKYRDAVQQAAAALATAKSNYEYAQTHYEAVKKAFASDAVSRMEVAQAENSLHQAEADIKNATASLESAEKMLSYCTVTAPIAGEVSANKLSAGAYVGGEGSPVTLATVYDNTTMTANFFIEDEKYLQLLKVNDPMNNPQFKAVEMEFNDTLPHRYTGELSYLAPALNKSTGTMELRCRIQNPYGELKAGMYVKIKRPYGTDTNAILVKDSSIGSDQLGKYLYVVNDSNRVVYTPIKTGDLYQDSMRVVISGLSPKSRYVTKALLKVKNGMTVNPKVVK